ncbi:hypothetical protein SDC9_127921 [bioreactor metagenome]|uniref:Uncharacterized protein n=1 Tax=bioreactor metagenome TaxID=1076179 RepID=A0A645CUP7_9ZZZZ
MKIVDEITDEALLGITVSYSVSRWIPTNGYLDDALNKLNSLFGKIIYAPLPKGREWIEHLDVLDAIRIESLGSLKKLDQYYTKILSGFVDVGIDKQSENYQKATEIIKNANLPNDILCDHELIPGFVRLQIININRLDLLSFYRLLKIDSNGRETMLKTMIEVTDSQKEAIKKIYTLYNSNSELKSQNISKFMEKWDEHENLKQLRNWWDAIPVLYTITPVGKVLAHANAQRCDPTLPALD